MAETQVSNPVSGKGRNEKSRNKKPIVLRVLQVNLSQTAAKRADLESSAACIRVEVLIIIFMGPGHFTDVANFCTEYSAQTH